MEICTQLICECNGKLYKSNATMKAQTNKCSSIMGITPKN